ncbi:MAG: oligosaccharide flippase family protein [Bacteroidales bacterium]|nr:oligosaccharide flippase family protein [Bacteroidales bacterium]
MQIKSKLKNAFKKDTYKNVFILFSGFSIAQAIPLLATLVLTRVFTKEQFGIFFIYSSLCMILSTFISLKLELAIVLPNKKDEGRTLFITSLLTSLIISGIVFLVILLLFDPITNILGDKNIGGLLYVLPLSLLFLGIVQACSYWLNRNNNFKDISIINVSKSLTSSIVQISLGLFSFLKFGLIIGLISGQFISAIYGIYSSFKEKITKTKHSSLKRVFDLISRYKKIPIYNTSIAVSNTLSNHLPIFLLTSYYSLEMTALYGLAHRIIATPMGLVSQSVGQVLYNEASKRHNSGVNLKSLIISTYKKLAKLAIIPTIFILAFAPFIFGLLFGQEWKLAGTFTQLLIPWLFFMFLNSPMTYIITILNKQNQLLIYDISLLAFRFLSLFVGYKFFGSITYSILLFSLTGVLFNIFLMVYILKISNTQAIEKD